MKHSSNMFRTKPSGVPKYEKQIAPMIAVDIMADDYHGTFKEMVNTNAVAKAVLRMFKGSKITNFGDAVLIDNLMYEYHEYSEDAYYIDHQKAMEVAYSKTFKIKTICLKLLKNQKRWW